MGKRTLTAEDDDGAVLAALASLRSPSRATLDLIYRDRFPLEDVADISGMDEEAVERWRVTALTELADELGVDDPEIAASMLERALGHEETAEVAPPPGAPSVRRIVTAAALALAVVIVVVVAAPGGGDESEPPPTPASSSEPSPETQPETEALRLSPLPGASGRGSVTVAPRDPQSRELQLELNGLPKPNGRYEAWLYSSVLDSESIGSIGSGDGTITADLPANAEDYEFLDISRQSSRGEPHSGRSVMRVPLAEILED